MAALALEYGPLSRDAPIDLLEAANAPCRPTLAKSGHILGDQFLGNPPVTLLFLRCSASSEAPPSQVFGWVWGRLRGSFRGLSGGRFVALVRSRVGFGSSMRCLEMTPWPKVCRLWLNFPPTRSRSRAKFSRIRSHSGPLGRNWPLFCRFWANLCRNWLQSGHDWPN